MTLYDDDMRTIIDLPEEQLEALSEICTREGISRAEAVRRAVAGYLRQEHDAEESEAFGIWRGRGVDALEYESHLREEWER